MKDKAITFDNMNLAYLEELVGRKPDAIEIREKWVIATYTQAVNDVRVHFRKW